MIEYSVDRRGATCGRGLLVRFLEISSIRDRFASGSHEREATLLGSNSGASTGDGMQAQTAVRDSAACQEEVLARRLMRMPTSSVLACVRHKAG